MYNKKLLSKIDLGKYSKPNPYKKDIIYDPMGQWKYPGQPTRIPSSNISMKGVNLPVLAVTDNGQKKMMQPGQEYNFPGANYVDEFPQAKKGGSLKSKKYTRSLDGIGSLFVESVLFQKPKNNKRRIFHPKAKYYAEGGMPDPGDVTCPEGYEINPKTGRCVLIKGEPGFIKNDVGEWVQDVAGKTVVEDENDERYKDYLIRKHLSDISKVPDWQTRAAILSDFTKSINNPNAPTDEWSNYYEKYYNPETGYDFGDDKDVFEDKTNKGAYGSRVQLFNNLTADQFNDATAKKFLNDQGFPTHDYFSLNNNSRYKLANYIPDSYLGRARLDDFATANYHQVLNSDMIKPTDNSWQIVKPVTSVVEDKINRDRIKKLYPNVTDKEINDEYKLDSNFYISNDRKSSGNRFMDYLNDVDLSTEMSNQNDNVFRDYVNSTKKFNNSVVQDNHVLYKPEDVIDYVSTKLDILPNYSEPIDKYIVRKTLADADPSVELYTNPDAPEYSPTNTSVDRPTLDIKLPSGNIKALFDKGRMGSKGHIHRGEREGTKFIPSLVQKFTGYDKDYMEGYIDDDGNYVPGEIENAQTEGRQINFKGRSSLNDKKAQEAYNQEWTQYQTEKDAVKQKNIELLQKYNLPTEEYLANTKKQGGSISKYNINTEHDLTDAEVARLKKLGYKLEKL